MPPSPNAAYLLRAQDVLPRAGGEHDLAAFRAHSPPDDGPPAAGIPHLLGIEADRRQGLLIEVGASWNGDDEA